MRCCPPLPGPRSSRSQRGDRKRNALHYVKCEAAPSSLVHYAEREREREAVLRDQVSAVEGSTSQRAAVLREKEGGERGERASEEGGRERIRDGGKISRARNDFLVRRPPLRGGIGHSKRTLEHPLSLLPRPRSLAKDVERALKHNAHVGG